MAEVSGRCDGQGQLWTSGWTGLAAGHLHRPPSIYVRMVEARVRRAFGLLLGIWSGR
jgi:hypothetical protein